MSVIYFKEWAERNPVAENGFFPVQIAYKAKQIELFNDASGCVLNLAQNVKRAYSSAMNKERAYHSNPEILGGTLVFKGTRVPVQSLFDHLKAGDSIEDFLEGFPSVKRSQVLAVLKEMETEVLAHA